MRASVAGSCTFQNKTEIWGGFVLLSGGGGVGWFVFNFIEV